ncbi:MAG: ATP-dependent sacrificial sulfur transferase LarE [Archangium sp.]|nr:ATP-dependent sacrificial sulfur transferase LarE [Archangium sp.]MDP3152476.1 ATP-dependent sacrificial sulfur transferase LarE [Archangium sp.]MDP3572354.1 ATP-dependent sacrificial sulfur transferase LarE [Archangium sp.]
MSSIALPQQPVLSDAQVDALCAQSADRVEGLRAALRAHGSALIAFSGGVDSALVLKLAVEQLGERAIALTAISASVAPDEAKEAEELAAKIGAKHVLVDSKELDDPRYAANPSNRCYFCKTELYAITSKHRAELGLAVVLDGFNADDKKDHRPGHKAAAEHAVRSPLAEAQLTKAEVRAWSKRLDLPTWDKPQMACLASRLPYGTQVTVERLKQVGSAEKAVRALGFVNFRVRYHNEVARLELGAEELARMLDPTTREAVNQAIKAQGFTFVAVDLEPFRSGRLNDALKPGAIALPVLT